MICELTQPLGFYLVCLKSIVGHLGTEENVWVVLSRPSSANVMLPVEMDLVFVINHTNQFEKTSLVIDTAYLENGTEVFMLEKSRSHVLKVSFPKGIPDLVQKFMEAKSASQAEVFALGLCNSTDFKHILHERDHD